MNRVSPPKCGPMWSRLLWWCRARAWLLHQWTIIILSRAQSVVVGFCVGWKSRETHSQGLSGWKWTVWSEVRGEGRNKVTSSTPDDSPDTVGGCATQTRTAGGREHGAGANDACRSKMATLPNRYIYFTGLANWPLFRLPCGGRHTARLHSLTHTPSECRQPVQGGPLSVDS